MPIHQVAKITKAEKENELVTTFTFDIGLEGALPGQFLMVWLPGNDEKPYGIAGISPLKISVAARGPFSKKFASLKVGRRVWLRGPYGKGFKLSGKHILLVGGGYGFAPLRFLADEAMKRGIFATAICGARSKGLLMADAKCETILATDDGSAGIKGNVIDAMKSISGQGKFDTIYTCGPERMMAAVAYEAKKAKADCQLLLERYMKCGIGICGHCCMGEKLVCSDGPVFGFEILENPEFCKTFLNKAGKREPL
ncbi:MAG: dihydroorotate dehydrogenase electron transfer subunit [Candidatus Micrarchaeota archaeon]|nr:dihydroorotate dehydrogenase electron transfer subunit [Candidatus Micrarchaeota archaeon]